MSHAVGVVGLGKLGTPLALLIAQAGHRVTGIDVDISRVASLSAKNIPDSEPGVQALLKNKELELEFDSDFNKLSESDVIYVIVPTPSLDSGYFSNDYVISALELIGAALSKSAKNQEVVVVSTVMPGSTRGILSESLHKNIQKDYRKNKKILYSPEFIALGSVIHNLRHPDIILVGAENIQDAVRHVEITTSIAENSPEVKLLGIEEAELVKLAINTFITMKITFANFIGEIARNSLNIDGAKVCESIGKDSRIGGKYLSPGLGFGGPCFPRDNRAFSAYSASLNLDASLAKATEKINRALPTSIARWIRSKYPTDQKIAILGLTYKENSEVTEESQSISLANELSGLGYKIVAHDPLLTRKPTNLKEGVFFSNELNEIYQCDIALKTINWESYDHIDENQIEVVQLR